VTVRDTTPGTTAHLARGAPESTYAWVRLFAALMLSAIGGIGMWSVIVALPAVQVEFGVARSAASLPYTITMMGFGFGGILMGRLSDRYGIFVPAVGGAVVVGLGYAVASQATSLWQFILAQGLLVGVASSVAFAPMVADTSLWFTRRRGIAVAIIASGSYLAGTVWPPVVEHFIRSHGWRRTYLDIAVFCVATMLPLALVLRRRAPLTESASAPRASARDHRGRSACRRARCKRCWSSPASAAALPCRCRRSISWRTAAISVMAPRAERRCSH
jgi:MFS family permease